MASANSFIPASSYIVGMFIFCESHLFFTSFKSLFSLVHQEDLQTSNPSLNPKDISVNTFIGCGRLSYCTQFFITSYIHMLCRGVLHSLLLKTEHPFLPLDFGWQDVHRNDAKTAWNVVRWLGLPLSVPLPSSREECALNSPVGPRRMNDMWGRPGLQTCNVKWNQPRDLWE